MRTGLTYDDICIVPEYSEIPSRSSPAIDTSVELVPGLRLRLPILSANMDTITETEMADAMSQAGGAGIIHRYMKPERLLDILHTIRPPRIPTIGLESTSTLPSGLLYLLHNADKLGLAALCVDVAHAHHSRVAQLIKSLREATNIPIIAGNVATAKGALYLAEAGASCIKVGIGSGSICTTREVSGCGVPQATAVMEVAQALQLHGHGNITIIADGGIRKPGDVVKAIACGAHAVMIGGMFATTKEACGRGSYRGMASQKAQQDVGRDPLFIEGISITVTHKEIPAAELIKKLEAGLRSGMAYTGCSTIQELRGVELIQITPSAQHEGEPHALSWLGEMQK